MHPSTSMKELNTVLKIANQFEEIVSATTYEANFNYCNWWLDFACYGDDDKTQESSNNSRYSSHDALTPNDETDEEIKTIQDTEVSEAAETTNDNVFPENDYESETFISQIESLGFVPEGPTDDVENVE